MIPSRKIFLMLGRFGDIVSILPLILHEHQQGNAPIMCVAAEFAGLLDGVSYCERIVFPGLYNDPPAALRWLKANRPRDQIIICQAYRHPFDPKKVTGSYQTENWRVAGALDQFGKHPTVFDQRDPERERVLRDAHGSTTPMILLATDSVSSPFRQAEELLHQLVAEFGESHKIVDLSKVRGYRPYDILGLMDSAACLITVDTFPLHLSRASKCPVIAITNDGYFGSISPPGAARTIRYADCAASLEPVMEAMREIRDSRAMHRFVIHSCDKFGGTPRHLAAKMTWWKAAGDEEVIDATKTYDYKPKLKELLNAALEASEFESDVIIWCNSDVAFEPNAFTAFKLHAGMWGACSMRRTEPGETKPHIGREVFAFRTDWLADHIDDIPDFMLAAPAFDLIIAAMIRMERGIVTTIDNLALDFWPCEMMPGIARHEPHPSSWAGENENTLPENKWNLEIARKWCAANMPSLKL